MFGALPAPPAGTKIGGVSKTLTTEYWRSLDEGYVNIATALGIEFVYQAAQNEVDQLGQLSNTETLIGQGFNALLFSPQTDANLIPAVEAASAELTVAQNIFLGSVLRRAGGLLVDRRAQGAAARRILAPRDPTIDVTAPVRGLSVAQRQIVGIAKALRANARIIAIDEPTSSLTPKEFERLVAVVARLTEQGVAVLYVSHKLDEVFRLCQQATILRDGRLIGLVPIPQTPVA